jgi:hypothetical protein
MTIQALLRSIDDDLKLLEDRDRHKKVAVEYAQFSKSLNSLVERIHKNMTRYQVLRDAGIEVDWIQIPRGRISEITSVRGDDGGIIDNPSVTCSEAISSLVEWCGLQEQTTREKYESWFDQLFLDLNAIQPLILIMRDIDREGGMTLARKSDEALGLRSQLPITSSELVKTVGLAKEISELVGSFAPDDVEFLNRLIGVGIPLDEFSQDRVEWAKSKNLYQRLLVRLG